MTPILPQPKQPTSSSEIRTSRREQPIYNRLWQNSQHNKKAFAVLIDPDNLTEQTCLDLLRLSELHTPDYFFVGGSLIMHNHQEAIIRLIKENSQVPVVLFPSSSMHIDKQADAILFISLISGRNPDLLIGQHVLAAPMLKASNLEVMPTGYILVDSGQPTTASYMSGSLPVPHNKPAIAACTAMAGELLGLRLMYIDGGSGAQKPVSPQMIAAVRQSVETPIIVGGGIDTAQKAEQALSAGADVIVIGNKIETNPGFLGEVAQVVNRLNSGLA